MTRDLAKLGLAVLLGAVLAFPAGMMVAGSRGEGERADPPAPRASAARRDMFSPSVRTDPWFLDRQREGVAALERYCRQTGQACDEARAARTRLTEIEAGT